MHSRSLAKSSLLLSLAATALLAPMTAAQHSLIDWIHEYTVDSDDLRSFYTLQTSPTARERMEQHDGQWLERLSSLDDADLTADERIDQVLLRSFIEHQRATARREGRQQQELAELLDFAEIIETLEEGRWTLRPVAPADAAARLDQLAQRVEELAERVQGEDSSAAAAETAPPLTLSAVSALRLARTVSNLSHGLDTWYEHDASFRPDFRWWVERPYERATEALEEYGRKLREDIAGQTGDADDPLVGDPIGADGLTAHLAHEFLPYDAAQLLAIGEAEFAWCEARMLEASAELGFGDDWHSALAEVKDSHAAPGEQDELVMAQAREAIAFLDERQLVTIPDLARETWRVRMLSSERQKVLPFAAYSRQHMLVAFPTDDMDIDARLQAMRGNNEHFSRIVTPHELIPGHHLQGFMAARYNVHRRLFSTPFYGEGWALYWEMLLWDEGWPRGPKDRIGMLFWRMHRAARIVVSLRFHLGTMSPPEMIDYLVERVGHERDNATAEVRRYIGGAYSPLYQCGYMIGGLQLRALAGELVGTDSDPGALSLREFHDAVLRCGPIPIELVRASLTRTVLTADHQASWMFAGDVQPVNDDGN